MSLHQLQASRPVAVRARAYFEDIVPRLLRSRPLQGELAARIGFRLHGESGGSWTIDGVDGRVLAGIQDPRATLTADVGTFESMLAGNLDVIAALADGRLQISGERSLFSGLAALLAAPQS